MNLVIGHLYPDLLNLYGDRGNIRTLKLRAQWRGMEVQVKEFALEDEIPFEDLDIVLLGGGSDREQLLVCKRLKELKKDFSTYAEKGGVILAVCGGYQLLGNYYQLDHEKVDGLGVLDIATVQGSPRLIGNIVLETASGPVVGFENHGGRTDIGSHEPFGRVLSGFGNDGVSGFEGVRYKNVLGTYLHGPILPKNPNIADDLLTRALSRKYQDFTGLSPLDDKEELLAQETLIARFCAETEQKS